MRIKIDDLAGAGLPYTTDAGFPLSANGAEMDRAALDAIVSRWRMTGRALAEEAAMEGLARSRVESEEVEPELVAGDH
jgi:hypothetical protein